MGTRPPSNPRQERKKAEQRLIFVIAFTLIVIGGLLIAWVYDWVALLTALPCLIAGSGAVFLLFGVMNGLEKWLKDKR